MRVVPDWVIGSSAARHNAALSAMEYLQHGARLTTSELVEELAGRSSASVDGTAPVITVAASNVAGKGTT
jgi:hypothetical protein